MYIDYISNRPLALTFIYLYTGTSTLCCQSSVLLVKKRLEFLRSVWCRHRQRQLPLRASLHLKVRTVQEVAVFATCFLLVATINEYSWFFEFPETVCCGFACCWRFSGVILFTDVKVASTVELFKKLLVEV